jgi:hypothetical protein
MTKKATFTTLLILTLLTLTACDSNGGESGNTTVQQDQQNIEASLDALLDAARDMEEGSFSQFVKTFAGANEGNYQNEDWAENMIDELDPLVAVDDEDRLAFDDNQGRYAWNASAEAWEQTGNSGNFVLEFPTSPSESVNDATLTVTSYEDQRVVFADDGEFEDADEVWLPTSAEAEMTVGGERVGGVTLNEAQYATGDFGIPTSVDLQIETAPFTHQIQWTRNEPTDFDLNVTLQNGGEQVLNLTANAGIADDDYADFEPEEDLESLSGTLSFGGGMRIEFDGTLGRLLQLDDPSPAQINEALNAVLFYNDQRIGELEYRERQEAASEDETAQEEGVYIVYKDETSENAARYYEDFAESLELIVFDYTGEFADFD